LKRDVALKILPESFASDPDRLARFQREAEVLASLSHPNIAAIHGFEDSGDVHALVLEFVDGETLADRIERGPIPLDEALPIAKQIAEALEAAHEQGIIHRDLKPANIKIRADGTVKVLDFGLAKLNEPNGPSGSHVPNPLSLSPTITSPALMTGVGVLLGTAAYMSPEQARGKAIDKRADIWAFGSVLYEMLTGRVAFAGATVSDTIAKILEREPDWRGLPTTTPTNVRRLLQRCLEKDSKRRLRDIGDARLEIEEMLAAPEGEQVRPPAAPRRPSQRLAWGLVAIVGAATLAASFIYWRSTAAGDTRVYRASLLPPSGQSLSAVLPFARFALSPDGRRLAFVAGPGGGVAQLWVQSLDGMSARALPGTEGALTPFWSPDSRFIAFYAGNKLKTIDANGGQTLTLADTAGFPGGTWNDDNVILFSTTAAQLGGAIHRVPASGGPVSAATKVNSENGETAHYSPFFLPDGRHFLYVASGSTSGGPNALNGIYVAALDSRERKLLVPGGSNAKYAAGYLLYLREQTLMAQSFDVGRHELAGDPIPVAEGVATGGLTGRLGAFTVSDGGALAFQRGLAGDLSQLVWVDRTGRQLGTVGDRGDYGDLQLSPDGQRAAVSFAETGGNYDIWVIDLTRGLRTRFTFDPRPENGSIWSPDGREILFRRNTGTEDLFRKASSGVGAEEIIQADTTAGEAPTGWSHDGHFVLYGRSTCGTACSDVWALPLTGDRKPFPFIHSPFAETNAAFSPDGRWVAYASNESGRTELYVTSFPTAGGKWQVSTMGGNWPRWRRNGREIFYLSPDNRLMAAPVEGRGSAFEVGMVQPLFDTRVRTTRNYMYDVSPDGERFLLNTDVETGLEPITLVVNWTATLKK
jgi:Tol biopolymer transport system component